MRPLDEKPTGSDLTRGQWHEYACIRRALGEREAQAYYDEVMRTLYKPRVSEKLVGRGTATFGACAALSMRYAALLPIAYLIGGGEFTLLALICLSAHGIFDVLGAFASGGHH